MNLSPVPRPITSPLTASPVYRYVHYPAPLPHLSLLPRSTGMSSTPPRYLTSHCFLGLQVCPVPRPVTSPLTASPVYRYVQYPAPLPHLSQLPRSTGMSSTPPRYLTPHSFPGLQVCPVPRPVTSPLTASPVYRYVQYPAPLPHPSLLPRSTGMSITPPRYLTSHCFPGLQVCPLPHPFTSPLTASPVYRYVHYPTQLPHLSQLPRSTGMSSTPPRYLISHSFPGLQVCPVPRPVTSPLTASPVYRYVHYPAPLPHLSQLPRSTGMSSTPPRYLTPHSFPGLQVWPITKTCPCNTLIFPKL